MASQRHRTLVRRLGVLHDGRSDVCVQVGLQDIQELLVADCGALLAKHLHIDRCCVGQAEFSADGQALQLEADGVGELALPGVQNPELAECAGCAGLLAEFFEYGQAVW